MRMEYYCIQSWQNFDGESSEGGDELRKESGDVIPENYQDFSAYSSTFRFYFSTYEEARAYFDSIYAGYQTMGVRGHIEMNDKVKGKEPINYYG
jgi:hypothetical protein